MTVTGGQSLTPYPYRERRKFNDSRRLIAPIVKVTTILAWLATLLSPPSWGFWMWSKFAYRYYNDSWRKRGLILIVIGAVSAALFVPSLIAVPEAWYAFLTAFGAAATVEPLTAAITAMIITFPYALIAQGLHSLARSFQLERTTDAFLKPQRPTAVMRIRRRLNAKKLGRGRDKTREGNGYVRFGVIVGDRIPWRQTRYGMIVERKIKKMGHGVIIGSNGMGKTKMAETFTHYILKNNSAMIYIDFKASLGTLRGLSAVAEENGRPCAILDIGFGTTDTSWYDLFAWQGSPSDKASVLVECLQFPEDQGGAAYYRGIAEAWLPMQIEAAELLGLQENEGMFDFLLQTAVPLRFKDRITPLRESTDPAIREKFERWTEEATHVKSTDLQGLRNELTKIVNAAGDRLKPNPDNPKPVSMKEVMDNGGMVYIGIAAGINDVVVKVLGSFLFKELSILVSARSRVSDPESLRDVFVIPDEASEMEERSVVMNPIYTMAREARIFIWPSFQSFAVWHESTQEEIRSNARNFVAFSIPSRETAEQISSTLPDIFALQQMQQEETKQQSFQNQTIGISGDTRLSVATDAFLRPNMELSDIDAYHAYIWFKDAKGISRTKWRGRRRVRKDENRGDAPLVKLVPYDLVMPHGAGDDNGIIPGELDNSDPTQLPPSSPHATPSPTETPTGEDTTPRNPDSGTSRTRRNQWDDYLVTANEPESDAPPEEDQTSTPDIDPALNKRGREESSEVVEPSEPPPLPSFAVRGMRRRREHAAQEDTTAVAGGPDAETAADASAAPPNNPPEEAASPTPRANESEPAASFPDPWMDDEFTDDGGPDTQQEEFPPVPGVVERPSEESRTPDSQESEPETSDEFADDGASPSSPVSPDREEAHTDMSEVADTNDETGGDSQNGGPRNQNQVASDQDNPWLV